MKPDEKEILTIDEEAEIIFKVMCKFFPVFVQPLDKIKEMVEIQRLLEDE